jgi:hypothetical protein
LRMAESFRVGVVVLGTLVPAKCMRTTTVAARFEGICDLTITPPSPPPIPNIVAVTPSPLLSETPVYMESEELSVGSEEMGKQHFPKKTSVPPRVDDVDHSSTQMTSLAFTWRVAERSIALLSVSIEEGKRVVVPWIARATYRPG